MAAERQIKSKNGPEEWIALLFERKLPSTEDIKEMCFLVKKDLLSQKNIINVPHPVTLVGDIHGQFYDLIEVFTVAGRPPFTSYLFMGDYVDRGHFSVETLLLLFALKLRYNSKISLLRGNHETRQITQVYGFYDECLKKFGGSEIWQICCEVFDCLPLAAVVGEGTTEARLAVHAGITPLCETLDQVNLLDRFHEVPHEGAVCDLVWSDPEETNGWGVSPRGAGFVFGGDIVHNFNHKNSLKQICRSHQLVMVGFKEMFDSQLVTIWSAPNYCYRCGNAGAVFEIDEDLSAHISVFGPRPAKERMKPSEENKFAELPDYFC